jgi:dTDP-4-dehydrorhamnose 3,5-epimerase
MKVKTSKILGLKLIYPLTNFKDKRGRYLEIFNKLNYLKILKKNFVEDDVCLNNKNVFRGIHGDYSTWKLVSCLYGKCISIIVNNDKKSKLFGKHEKFVLSSDNYFQILIPPKYGNSFLVTSSYAIYHYKQTKYYKGQKKQFTLNVKDPFLKIKLPSKKLIISKRDKTAKYLFLK